LNFLHPTFITNYCKAIEAIKNIESNQVLIIQIKDKAGYRFYILVDEGSFKFFNNFLKFSYDLVTEEFYINCSNKESDEIKHTE
jgi:hypothetical protein